MTLPHPLPPNQSIDIPVPLSLTGPVQKSDPINSIQIAFKNNVDIFYTVVSIPLCYLFVHVEPIMNTATFTNMFGAVNGVSSLGFEVKSRENEKVDDIWSRLTKWGVCKIFLFCFVFIRIRYCSYA